MDRGRKRKWRQRKRRKRRRLKERRKEGHTGERDKFCSDPKIRDLLLFPYLALGGLSKSLNPSRVGVV